MPVAKREHRRQSCDGYGVVLLLSRAVRVGRDREHDCRDAAIRGLGEGVTPGPGDQQVMTAEQARQRYRPGGDLQPRLAVPPAGDRRVRAEHDARSADLALCGEWAENGQHLV